MEIIKYRAWDRTKYKEGIMVQWDELKKFPCEIVFMNLLEVELMQFIGLKDKDSGEIYKDDILKAFTGAIIVVDFHNGSFGYWIDKDKPYRLFVPFVNHSHIKIKNNQSDQIKIIGNRHENQELLK